jgi:hypothetical protein
MNFEKFLEKFEDCLNEDINDNLNAKWIYITPTEINGYLYVIAEFENDQWAFYQFKKNGGDKEKTQEFFNNKDFYDSITKTGNIESLEQYGLNNKISGDFCDILKKCVDLQISLEPVVGQKFNR